MKIAARAIDRTFRRGVGSVGGLISLPAHTAKRETGLRRNSQVSALFEIEHGGDDGMRLFFREVRMERQRKQFARYLFGDGKRRTSAGRKERLLMEQKGIVDQGRDSAPVEVRTQSVARCMPHDVEMVNPISIRHCR